MLYIFDWDGTLVVGYLDRADKDYHVVDVLPGRRERLAELRAAGHQVAIATNQGGVAFGFVDIADYDRKIAATLVALDLPADTLVAACFSDVRGKPPWNDPAAAARRKPSGAMIRELRGETGTRAEDTMFIGDRPEDQAAAADDGVAFMWAHEFFKED